MDDLNKATSIEVASPPSNTEGPVGPTGNPGTQGVPTEETETEQVEATSKETTEVQSEENPTVSDETQEQGEESPTPSFAEQLSELSEGKFKDIEDVRSLAAENERLKSELEEANSRSSEQGRKIAEYAKKYPGDDWESVKRVATVMSLDLEKLSDRDKIFEDFALKEENQSVPRSELRKVFDEIYEEKYGDETEVSRYNLRVDAHKADKNLRGLREEYSAQSEQQEQQTETSAQKPESTKEELEQITAGVDEALSKLDKITYEFGDNEKEHFKFQLDDKYKTEEFREKLVDPAKALQDWLSQFSKDGKFDYQAYARGMVKWMYADDIASEQFGHGVNIGAIRKVTETKNPSKPDGKPTQTQTQKSFWEKFAEAKDKATGGR